MTTWYVRPSAAHGGSNNGTSYANAWQGWSAIVWGASGVKASDTLYVCGTFSSATSLTVGNHTASTIFNRCIIRGDYPGDSGSLIFSGAAFFNFRSYTRVQNLVIVAGTNVSIYVGNPNGTSFVGCNLSGASSTGGISFDGNTSYSDIEILDNIIHDIQGSQARGISMLVNGVSASVIKNVTIKGNHIYNIKEASVRFSIETNGYAISKFENFIATNNVVHDCGGPFQFRSGYADTSTPSVTFSNGLKMYGNSLDRCGTIAGANGMHGGISVSGWSNVRIYKNKVWDVYVTGAGIQTSKNRGILIYQNDIRRIRSGTPTGQFQSGFPIDGNGIFADNLTESGMAWGNYVEDLISTGITNSGTALSFWEAKNFTYSGNVAVNCYRGMSYGAVIESNNHVINNTFINCAIGVTKIGTVAPGAITVKNNIFVNCTEGFNIGTNPSIIEDYNCLFGCTTNYTGITKGANSTTNIDPQLSATFAPKNAALKSSGTFVGYFLKDYNNRPFSYAPTMGAIELKQNIVTA